MNRDALISVLDSLTKRERNSIPWQRLILQAYVGRVLTKADYANYGI